MADSLHSPPPGSAQPGLPEEVLSERRTLRDYLIILRERLWIALPLALLVAIGLGYHKAGEVPRYAATATMQFEKAERVVSSEKVVDPTVTNELDFNTRLEVLRSDRIRRRVVESLTPDEIRILQRPFLQDLAPGQEPPSVWSTLGSLSVNPVRNSFIIRITVDHRDVQQHVSTITILQIGDDRAGRFVDQLLEAFSGQAPAVRDPLGIDTSQAGGQAAFDRQHQAQFPFGAGIGAQRRADLPGQARSSVLVSWGASG
jgi:hypothetical protein